MAERILQKDWVKIHGEYVSLKQAQDVADRTSNVFNIEARDYRNPVGSTMVFGVGDDAGNERIVMFSIVPGLTREKLLRTAAEDFRRFSAGVVPTSKNLHVLEDFPRLPTGKVDLRAMKQMALSS